MWCAQPAYFVNASGYCERCPSGCKTCASGTGECTECFIGFYKTAYGGECQLLSAGHFLGSDNLIYECDPYCNTCAFNSTFCTSCPTGRTFLQDGQCVKCPEGWFIKNNECRPCESFCRTCSLEAFRCTSCFSDNYLSPSNFSCTACTGGGFYRKQSGECLPCEATCKNCSEWTGICNECKGGMALMYDRIACTECNGVDMFRGSDNKCYFCDVNCASCFGTPTNCTRCTGSYLSIANKTCGICGVGYFPSGDYCYKCDSSCVECTELPHKCIVCPTGKILMTSNNTCVDNCPAEHFLTPYLECHPCIDNCAECQNQTGNCTKCREGTYLMQATRRCEWCEEARGFYLNTTDSRCYKCMDICKTCLNDTTCSSCENNYFISEDNGTCTSCGEGYFVDWSVNGNLKCKQCDAGCRVCEGKKNYCTQCQSGYYFSPDSRTCVSICSTGSFVNLLNQCVPCANNCTSCSSPYGHCQTCIDGLVPIQLTGHVYCGSPCPSKFYLDTSLKVCLPCNVRCAECSKTATNCTACSNWNDKSYLSTTNSTCSPCGYGFYPGPQGKCFPCTGNCLHCQGASSQTCSRCNTPAIFV